MIIETRLRAGEIAYIDTENCFKIQGIKIEVDKDFDRGKPVIMYYDKDFNLYDEEDLIITEE